MLSVELDNIGKRYNYQWIIRNVNLKIPAHSRIAITGDNGSGKSTLLKIIAGFLSPTTGQVKFSVEGKNIPDTVFFQHLSLSAPYLSLIDEFTVDEIISFHKNFKKFNANIATELVSEMVLLNDHKHKRISELSSGMTQRLKLGLAILSDTPFLLLDEPTSYLDEKGKMWFHDLLNQYSTDRTIIIASNDREDYSICDQILAVSDLK